MAQLLISERQYKELTKLLSSTLCFWEANDPTKEIRKFSFNKNKEVAGVATIVFTCHNDFSGLKLFIDSDQLILKELSAAKKATLIEFLKNIDEIDQPEYENNVIDLMEIFHGRKI